MEVVEQAFRYGAFDFVPKPLDRDRLIWSVNLAIKTHRLRRRIEERRVYGRSSGRSCTAGGRRRSPWRQPTPYSPLGP
jgi:FixJ family two-component response regulator